MKNSKEAMDGADPSGKLYTELQHATSYGAIEPVLTKFGLIWLKIHKI